METDAGSSGERGFTFSDTGNSYSDGFTFDYKADHSKEINDKIEDAVVDHDTKVPVDKEASQNMEGRM